MASYKIAVIPGDGIGNECQCGDGNLSGDITALDIGVMAQCANGQIVCDTTITDTNGDVVATSIDISAVAQQVNGVVQPWDLTCARNPNPNTPYRRTPWQRK